MDGECVVTFEPSGRTVRVRPGTTVMAATKAAGLNLGAACESDLLCGLCKVQVLAGGDTLSPPASDELRVLRALGADPGERLACRARVAGPVTLTADYW